jgi:hypothetical protein
MNSMQKAERFFEQHGRDIDQALFHYHFGALPQEELLAVLARYQNADGGFWGLEVDIAAPESNPFATELALHLCHQAGVPGSHPLLQKTAAYLEATQSEDGDWHFSDAIYRHNLAPWFQGWTWPTLNPACTTAGLLRDLGLGSERLHGRVERLFQKMANETDLTGDQFYAVRPYAFYFLPEWEHPQRSFYLAGVLWWLIRQHHEGKLPDSGHFFEYVRNPHTWIGRRLPERLLAARLDALAAEQADDGGWPSPYSEGWRGWLTAQNLITLRAFGRIGRQAKS